jgi:hypothetical protein
MKDLIEALQIFLKYGDTPFPTNCSHDVLAVCYRRDAIIDPADVARLAELSFTWSEEYDAWKSFRFGSC